MYKQLVTSCLHVQLRQHLLSAFVPDFHVIIPTMASIKLYKHNDGKYTDKKHEKQFHMLWFYCTTTYKGYKTLYYKI